MSRRREAAARQAAIEAAASEWLVKHDRGLTPAQQDEFLQWHAADPAHRESFRRHRLLWKDFNALAQWRPEHATVPNPDLLARPRRHHRLSWALPLAAAAAVIIATGAFHLGSRRGNAGPVAFEATTYRQETLPDGSLVDLNRGAHLVVQFTATERRVLLVQGEAQFTVTKNPAVPFIVRAGNVDVRAVGTAFNVKLAADNVEVLVTEGVVRVSPPARPAGPAEAPTPPAPALAELSAGQRTVLRAAAAATPPPVTEATAAEIDQLLEWTPRMLEFDSTPLVDVVAAFNRRNEIQLVIADDRLRALPIVASVRSNNVTGFVRLLEATMGVRSESRTPTEIVLRRAP